MSLDFWAKTSGTWINVATVLIGTGLGLLLRGRLPLAMQQIITQGLGLTTLFMGVSMAGSLNRVQIHQIDGVILGLLAIVLGGLLGEWSQIETRLNGLGNWLKHQVGGQGRFTEGFVTTSLLFCVGPMMIIGCLNNGLAGDPALLILKSVMDGLASIAFASSYGGGVGFSAIIILLCQGSLSLAAGNLAQALPNPSTAPSVLLITGVGGLIIMGLGLNLLEVAKIRVASFLPALVLILLLLSLADRLFA